MKILIEHRYLSNAEAFQILSKYSGAQVSEVQEAYNAYIKEISDAFQQDRINHAEAIRRDYTINAVELTCDQFDEIWEAMETLDTDAAFVA